MITFDGFVDTYFAYNWNEPVSRERSFTTQPLRDRELNINLAHAGLTFEKNQFRSRISLQGGNSVTANTQLESNKALGHIQEAYAGIKCGESGWLDGGVYLSHIGSESWISFHNPTYSRSLNLDYVPYYSAGLRYTYADTFELHVINGWQNISETNSAKAVGMKFRKVIDSATFSYNNFLGDEKVFSDRKSRFRTYHNFILEKTSKFWHKMIYAFDLGTEAQQEKSGTNTWFAATFTLQKKYSEKFFSGHRIEGYADPHAVNVRTPNDRPFQVLGLSSNVDYFFHHNFLGRLEVRRLKSPENIFPSSKGARSTDTFLVTSLSLKF